MKPVCLAGREPLQLGHVVLDDEAAARLQVPSRVAEALDLFVLSRQVRDRVAQQVDEAEPLGHRGREVADGHADVGGAAAPGAAHHRRGQLDPVHPDAPPAQRHAMRPVPMPSSSAGPAPASRRGSPRPARSRGIEQLGPQRLVALGDPRVEVGLGHVKTLPGIGVASEQVPAAGAQLRVSHFDTWCRLRTGRPLRDRGTRSAGGRACVARPAWVGRRTPRSPAHRGGPRRVPSPARAAGGSGHPWYRFRAQRQHQRRPTAVEPHRVGCVRGHHRALGERPDGGHGRRALPLAAGVAAVELREPRRCRGSGPDQPHHHPPAQAERQRETVP